MITDYDIQPNKCQCCSKENMHCSQKRKENMHTPSSTIVTSCVNASVFGIF